jgi:hypothetical protein
MVKISLDKPLSVFGINYAPGEYDVSDPFLLRELQTQTGAKVKLGEQVDRLTGAEESNALRYANQAKLAQLEAELTRREQWAPVNYRDLRQAEFTRARVEGMDDIRSQIGSLRAKLEEDAHNQGWDDRTALYHPDRTEAMPADVAGGDVTPLKPGTEATPDQGDYRVPYVVSAGRSESPLIAKAFAEQAEANLPNEGDVRPAELEAAARTADQQQKVAQAEKSGTNMVERQREARAEEAEALRKESQSNMGESKPKK